MTADDRIASILREWIEARDRGEEVDPEEVIAAHPELADELRERFETLSLLDAAAEQSGLTLFPDLRDKKMPAVYLPLGIGERPGGTGHKLKNRLPFGKRFVFALRLVPVPFPYAGIIRFR